MAVPKNYFRHVAASAWLGVPIAFGLLPMSGFCPSTLECVFPTFVMSFILANQATFAYIFKLLLTIHSFELVYALYRCNKLNLTGWTTVKWLLNVSIHGVFALKMLHWPEHRGASKKKN